MSKILAFWRAAFELSETEFTRLDQEGLAIMAAALSPQESTELLRWQRWRERQ
jgi:hypothetical protein